MPSNDGNETVERLKELFLSYTNISKEKVQEELEKFQTTPVNIAFIGQVKVGKSTLINSLRELYPNDNGSAPVDVEACTATPTPYAFLNHQNITLWDAPGVNVPGYSVNNYLENIKNFEIKENGK